MKLPREGTRRRQVYDMLIAQPREWVDVTASGIYGETSSKHTIWSDLDALRNSFGMTIITESIGARRWKYIPEGVA